MTNISTGNHDYLLHLYGMTNGIFLSSSLLLALALWMHYRLQREVRLIKAYGLFMASYIMFALYALFFQRFSGAPSAVVIPDLLYAISKFSAPIAQSIMTYIFMQVSVARHYETYAFQQRFRFYILSLYGLNIATLVALVFIPDDRWAALLITLSFIPHALGAAYYSYHGLKASNYRLIMSLLFSICVLSAGMFSFEIYLDNLDPYGKLAWWQLSMAVIALMFSYIIINYNYDEASPFFFERDIDPHHLMQDVFKALEQEELFLVFQPKIDLASNTVVSLEALIRWKHPERGLVPPAQFVPLIERTDFIEDVSEWVIRSTVRQARELREQGRDIKISLNLSARNLTPDTIRFLLMMLYVEKLPRDSIVIEITESLLVNEAVETQTALALIRQEHIPMSLDDYGTGFSSLSYIHRLPLSEIKIDRSFVTDIDTKQENYVITNSTIRMGKSLGLKVVAEGVESEADFLTLKSMQCDMVQGYYISPPLDSRELELWLKTTAYRIQKVTDQVQESTAD